MDGFITSLGFLCLAGLMAVLGAHRYLRMAQAEFQSRLRNAALLRARRLLLGALGAWGAAALLSAFGVPNDATAAANRTAVPARVAEATPAVQLQLDDDINFTGR